MRFERLELRSWSVLKNLVLDFSAGPCGLHVILGDNEAGKSSTRRAISAVLYGIPAQTRDAFRFGGPDIALLARLAWADGSVDDFTRRKSNKAPLQDSTGRPLVLPRLAQFTQAVSREQFELEYSLDHQQLREGGEQLLEGKGAIGESLLSAGLGGLEVAAVIAALGAEAKARFAPRANANSTLSALLTRFGEQREALKKALSNPVEVQREREALGTLKHRLDTLTSRRRELELEAARLDRVEAARPSFIEREVLLARLTELKRSPVVSADFSARRRAAAGVVVDAQAARREAELSLGQQAAALAALHVDAVTLACSADIEALAAREEKCESERARLVSLHAAVKGASDAASAAAAGVGRSPERLAELASGPYRAQAETVKRLARQEGTVTGDVARLEGELATAERALGEGRAREEALPPAADDPELRAVHARLVEEASEKEWKRASAEADQAEAEAAAELDALSRWTGTRAQLEKAALPATDECVAFEDEFKGRKKLEDAEEALAQAEGRLKRLKTKLTQLSVAGDIPSPTSLKQVRSHRQKGWKLIRATLDGEKPSASTVRQFAGEGTALPDAYESQVEKADLIADSLAEDGARAGKYETALEEASDAAEQVAEKAKALKHARQKLEDVEARWRALWKPTGLEPESPGVMRRWLDKAEMARSSFRRAAATKKTLATFEKETRAWVEPAAARLGVKVVAAVDLARFRAEATSRVKALESAATTREAVARERRAAADAVKELEARLGQARVIAAHWAKDWAEVAQGLGAKPEVKVAELEALVVAITDTATALREQALAEPQCSAVKEWIEGFERDVLALGKRLGMPEHQSSAVVLVRARDRRKAALASDAQRHTVQALIANEKTALETAELREQEAAGRLELLHAETGTADPAALVRIEEDNETRRGLQGDLEVCTRTLATIAGGSDLGGLEAEVAATPAVLVAERRRTGGEELVALEAERSQLERESGAVQQRLDAVKGTDDAAEFNEALEATRAAMRDEANHYLRLRHAESLLTLAVEAYRAENQSPLLKRASALFARLTLQSFEGLEVDETEGTGVLVGRRRASGRVEFVRVEAMSDGTRDELFLALRVAVLEQGLETNEPLPLIVDDTLINLSDGRARAALEILAELGAKTQVLLFTHHGRVAELVKDLAGAKAFVHVLNGDAERAKAAVVAAGFDA